MANNFTANASTINGGPVISMVDTAGSTYPTTGLAQSVALYGAINTSTQPTLIAKANPLYVRTSDGTNAGPTMDAAARAGYVYVTNGTQTLPSMDAAARPGFIKVTDGTGTLGFDNSNTTAKVSLYGAGAAAGDTAVPAMDAVTHPGYITITDGTGTLGFDNSNTTAKVSLYGKGSAAGDTAIPAGDTAAHAIFVSPNDGTNKFLSGTATNVAAGVGTNAMLVTKPGAWTANNTGAASELATVAKTAGGAGVKYVVDSICVSLAAGAAAQTPLTATLVQDAGGTPLTLWAGTLAAPANSSAAIALTGLSIVQTVAAKTLTLAFSGTGTANTIQSVSMTGTSVA